MGRQSWSGHESDSLMRAFSLLLGCMLLLAGVGDSPAQAEPVSHQAEFEKWCDERSAWLVKPDGYLSLVGLHWLQENPVTVTGIGEAYLEGKDVVLSLEPGWTADGKPVENARVTPEQAVKTKFVHGDRHFYVNHHGNRVNLRVKDSNSPRLKNFTGVERSPFDSSWRVVGRFEADKATIPVTSIVDETLDESSPGYAVFDHEGTTYKLRLMGEEHAKTYFLVFSDATAGKTTYPACRFLNVFKDTEGGLVLDFNRAWNPPCSMTPYATCPLPPEGNILPFEIPVGEQYH